MCKIMALTNSKKIENLEMFINTVRPIITERDKDGFGWAASGSNGVFGERTTNVKSLSRLSCEHEVTLPVIKQTFNGFGKKGETELGMIIHGRVSTNNKSLVNTHPLRKRGWTLVHNGVVTNHGPEYKMITTNDTEHILEHMSTKGIGEVVKNLTGYYAFAAIDNRNFLHVCRDKTATLHIAYISTIDSYVFATTSDLIEELCKKMEYKSSPIEEIEDDVYMIFNGNEMVHNEKITSRGYGYTESQHASKSLSYLDNYKSSYDYNGKWTGYGSKAKTSFENSKAVSSANMSGDIEKKYAKFFDEVKKVDATYEIYGATNEPLTASEFKKLNKKEQLECTIITNGVWIDPEEGLVNMSA